MEKDKIRWGKLKKNPYFPLGIIFPDDVDWNSHHAGPTNGLTICLLKEKTSKPYFCSFTHLSAPPIHDFRHLLDSVYLEIDAYDSLFIPLILQNPSSPFT